jgi:hypothetical protein
MQHTSGVEAIQFPNVTKDSGSRFCSRSRFAALLEQYKILPIWA